MIPLEWAVCAGILAVLGAWLLARPDGVPRLLLGVLVALTVLGLIAGTALAALMPLRFLPAPTGPHRIGTTVFSVTDESRDEIFLPGSGRRRTLTVQAWYPTDATSGPAEPYLRDPDALAGLLDYVGLPHWVLSYLHHAETHALTDAPVASAGRLPVVFALTGNMGYRQSQTVQVEELASHGYVVVGFDQPGTASSALLLDGTRIPYGDRTVLKPVIDQSIEAVSPAPLLNGIPYPDGLAPYLAADGATVLDRLTAMDAAASGPFSGRLDLTRVGAFGMSLGGYTLSQWCATDHRLGACLFMDAPMTLDARAAGLDVPGLWLTRPASDMAAEGWPPVEIRHNAGTERTLYEESRAPCWYVEVSGLLHADLTDAPFGSPLFRFSGLTSGDGIRAHAVMRAVTLAFFERTLRGAKGGPTALLDQREAPWPGVTLEARR